MALTQLPNQRKTSKQKDQKWWEQSIDAIIDMSSFNLNGDDRNLRSEYRDLYDGVIRDKDYKDVLRPFGMKRENFPDMQNWNIIKPLVDVLVGEKEKRPISKTVLSANADSVSNYEEKKFEEFKKAVYNNFIAEQQAMGNVGGEQKKKVPSFEDFEKEFEETYRDERAVRGQHALNYLKYSENLDYHLKQAFKNFLIEGMVVTHVVVVDDDLRIEFPDPLNVDYDKDPEIEMIEDAQWAVIRRKTSWSNIIRLFGTYIEEEYGTEALDDLQDSWGTNISSTAPTFATSGADTDENYNNENPIEYYHVYWKSLAKIGIVRGIDPETGEFYEREVDDTYKKAEWEMVEWHWEEEVWEGVRIGDKYYVRAQPVPVQRKFLTKRGTKLPVNGRVYADNYHRPLSLVGICRPYQIMFNIYMYRLERLIAKSRENIAVFDINFIPEKFESFDEFFYWIDKTGIAFVDYDKEGYRGNPQHQSYIDLTAKSISQYVELLRFMLESIERLSGVNQQRQGQVGTYAGKGTTERAVVQSSHITEDYFFKFAEFERSFYQSLLDYSKAAWLDGKKIHYIGDDNKAQFYEIDGIQHMESEYNIMVSNNIRDVEDLEAMRELAQSFAQNGMPMSAIAETIRAKNFSQLKEKITEAEEEIAKQQQAQQEMEQQQQQQEQEMKKEELNVKKEISDNEIASKKEIAQMELQKEGEGSLEEEKHQDETRLEEQKLQEEKRSNKADEELKRQEIKQKKKESNSGD